MIIVGHRGAAGRVPENTLMGIDTALRSGAHAVELDVQVVRSATLGRPVPIVMHDLDLDRTTSGTGPIADTTLETIRRLDAGLGERVPTLEEALDFLQSRRAPSIIELKGSGTADAVADVLSRRDASCVLVSSFDQIQLARFRTLAPHVNTAVVVCGVPADLAWCASDASGIHVSIEFVHADLVADARERGLHVLAYTVNTVHQYRRAVEAGVDGIITDYPDVFAQSQTV